MSEFLIQYECNKCKEIKFVPSNDGVLPITSNLDLTHMKSQLHVGTYYCGIFEKAKVYKTWIDYDQVSELAIQTVHGLLDNIKELVDEAIKKLQGEE